MLDIHIFIYLNFRRLYQNNLRANHSLKSCSKNMKKYHHLLFKFTGHFLHLNQGYDWNVLEYFRKNALPSVRIGGPGHR